MVTNASRTISSIIIMKNRETADRVRPPKILVYNQDECRSITLPSGISLIYMVRSYVPFVTSRPPVSDGPVCPLWGLRCQGHTGGHYLRYNIRRYGSVHR